MKIDELRALGDEQLVHREIELERSLLTQTFRHRLGQLENTSQLGRTRRAIARAQTLLTEREKEQGLGKGALKARHASSYVAAPAAPKESEAGGGFLKGILDRREAQE